MAHAPGSCLFVSDHSQCGLVQRTRFELTAPTQPLLPLPPCTRRLDTSSVGAGCPAGGTQCWLYAESRVVVLIDVRRGNLLSAEWALDSSIELLLESLASGPDIDETLCPTMHITVALASREAFPLRVLVQGWRQRCGHSPRALRELVLAQLRQAADEAPLNGGLSAAAGGSGGSGNSDGGRRFAGGSADAPPGPFSHPGAEATRREGLHGVVDEGARARLHLAPPCGSTLLLCS